jgi:glucosamine-6-phosphate deaminase
VKVRVFSTPERAARELARVVAAALLENPAIVLGLPTGRTPVPFYRELVALHRAGRVDFSRATTFNLDEFVGIAAASDAGSYRAFMNRHLFDHVNLRRARVHFLNGAAADTGAECRRYERLIRRAGGIDLQLLGLGANGHVGFNEPGRALQPRTHRTRLRPATRRANAPLFGGRLSRVPREALSMGMATILAADRVVLLATGAAKAACVKRMVEGAITTRVPASLLQLHANAEVWLDRAAAAKLEVRGQRLEARARARRKRR